MDDSEYAAIRAFEESGISTSFFHSIEDEDEHLFVLDLIGGEQRELPNAFDALPHLQRLYVSGKFIRIPETLCQLQNLSNLTFLGDLTNLPPEFFNLTSLRYLSLAKNSFNYPITDSFASLINLEYLSLANTHFGFPNGVNLLPRLKSLYLANCWIDFLPQTWNTPCLRNLDVSQNRLHSLSSGLPFSSFEEFDASQNLITADYITTDGVIPRFENIRVLMWNDNNLTTIPFDLAECSRLEILDLSQNVLRSLPPEIGQLHNLGMLSLNQNHLHFLPPEICELPNLYYLDLSKNDLETLPENIDQIDLKSLLLGYNQLKGLPPLPPRLESLSIESNQLGEHPDGPGSGLIDCFMGFASASVGNNVSNAEILLAGEIQTYLRTNIGYFYDWVAFDQRCGENNVDYQERLSRLHLLPAKIQETGFPYLSLGMILFEILLRNINRIAPPVLLQCMKTWPGLFFPFWWSFWNQMSEEKREEWQETHTRIMRLSSVAEGGDQIVF